ncbi:MAG: hypothetical protein ACPGUF_05895, partial [Litorivicinus sp.]
MSPETYPLDIYSPMRAAWATEFSMNKSMIAAALVVASAPVCAEIDPIVIIGDRYESPVESLPQAIHVISKQDIADRGA